MTTTDDANNDKGKEPLAKMVKVNDLEASIERILEKTLRKAAEGQATSKTTQNTTASKKDSPCQKEKGFSLSSYGSALTNTVVFLIDSLSG